MKRLLLCLALIGALAGMFTAQAVSKDIPIGTNTFPDANFRSRVVRFDINHDGKLSQAEAASVTELDVSDAEIADLTGIEHFTALQTLNCSGNHLTVLSLQRNTALTELYCFNNQLTRLDVRTNTALAVLNCQDNHLTSLDLRFNSALGELLCNGNQLSTLDISACPELLRCVRVDLFIEDAEDGTANYYREYDGSYYVYDIIHDLGTRLITRGGSDTVLTLPARLTAIQSGAFKSIAANVVICPDGLTTIGSLAFANCGHLREIHIPASVTTIADDAFTGCYELVIITNSAAIRAWADSHGILWKPA